MRWAACLESINGWGLEKTGVEEVLVVPLHAEYGRVDEVDLCAVLLNDTVAHAFDGGLTGVGIADDAAFADVGATCFELGFDEDDGGAAPWLIGSAERVEGRQEGQGLAEMKETSIAMNGGVGVPGMRSSPGVRRRALVRSRRVTRGSSRSFCAIWP